jgi:periplasmic protein TonB
MQGSLFCVTTTIFFIPALEVHSIVVGMKTMIAVVVLLAGFSCGFVGQDQAASPSPTPTPSPTATPTPSPHGPPGPGTKRVRISSGVAEGLIRHKVDPVYPWDAKVNHITGDVLLKAVIDRQGNIANLELLRGDPTLAESAIKAVKQWKYRPYILNGEAIEAETTVKIQYHM